MTDKEKILQEIERLQKPTTDANHNFTSDYNQGLYDGLSQLELFIESLPEEKKSIREYVSPEDSTLGKLLKEMKDFSPQEDLGLSNEEYNDVVNELIFSKEEPVSKDLEDAQEQMMKDAVEAVIEEPECLVWRITADLEGDFVVKHNLRDGDKVKVLIIKEE